MGDWHHGGRGPGRGLAWDAVICGGLYNNRGVSKAISESIGPGEFDKRLLRLARRAGWALTSTTISRRSAGVIDEGRTIFEARFETSPSIAARKFASEKGGKRIGGQSRPELTAERARYSEPKP